MAIVLTMSSAIKVQLGGGLERSCSEAADLIEEGITRWRQIILTIIIMSITVIVITIGLDSYDKGNRLLGLKY